MEILAQSSTAFVLTHNFQGTHILGASRGRLSDNVASCLLFLLSTFGEIMLHDISKMLQSCSPLVTILYQAEFPGKREAVYSGDSQA